MRTFLSFIKKEFLQIFRDRRTILILLGMPIVQIILFGFAISTEIRNINFAVIAPQHTEIIRQVIERIDANNYFSFVGFLNSSKEIDKSFRNEKADIVLVFDRDMLHKRATGEGLSLQIEVDASNPNTAKSETMYLTSILNDFFAQKQVQKGIQTNVRLLYNPQMKSAYNFVPGIMGLILMLICAMMTSISIVREKEIGTMEVLLVSPTKPIYIIFAKMAPYFVLSCTNFITILLLSVFVLHIPIVGDIFWISAISLLYIFLALAIGLLISTVMKTQVSAMIISAAGLLFPTIMLSGMIYPIENTPLVLQWLSYLVPARWYISAIRKLMIEGLSISYAATEFGVLLLMSALMIIISLKKFKNRLE